MFDLQNLMASKYQIKKTQSDEINQSITQSRNDIYDTINRQWYWKRCHNSMTFVCETSKTI